MLDRIWGAQEKRYVEPLELFTKDELKEAAIPEDIGLARMEAKIFSERLIRDFVISPTGGPAGDARLRPSRDWYEFESVPIRLQRI